MISLLSNSNHFYSKLFSKLKNGIAFVFYNRPSKMHPGERYSP